MKISKDKMKTIIKEKMEDYYKKKGIIEPSNIHKGYAFAYFYVTEILSNKFNLTDEEIEDGLNIDGAGDLGADCIFIKDDNYLIFQFKYKGKKHTVDRDEIAGFKLLHDNLINKNYVIEHGNEELKFHLQDFTSKKSVYYYFVTNVDIDEYLKETKTKSEKIDYSFVDLNEIWIEYKNTISQSKGIPDKVKIPIQTISRDNKAYLDITKLVAKETDYETVILIIKGSQIKSIYEYNNNRESLFTYNIRGYLGAKPVNKKIKNTIINHPELFYYLNNGISAICTSYEVIEDGPHTCIECENFQIINGAQTVSTIAKMEKEYLGKLNDVQVIMRLTKAGDLKSEKKGINREIITANNNQTAIKISDFRSNDDIQVFLEKELQKFSYKGQNPHISILYQPKRRYHKKRKNEYVSIMQMDTLAKLLYSFMFDPITFQSKSSLLYETDSNLGGLYWKVFGEDDEELNFYDKCRTKEVAAIITIWIHLQEMLKNEKKVIDKDSIRYQSTLAKWQIIYAIGYVYRFHDSISQRTIVNHILDGKYLLDNGAITKLINNILEIIEEIIGDEYDSSESDMQKAFNLRNWMRSKISMTKIQRKLDRRKLKLTIV
ncbi:MAG: AIPR family protein [Spirochaetaceae bacterium]